ncbi:MAG: hypothetical protein US52_C0051G0011 [candidate division WS6 bacterium GW2011_GWA2_37_6]|uniref:N-end rule aminoacyl transferase C-terminal domain-containing protein n=1 Tax=candidate division WS6 bacterium GW2011_GWA2_37_6 TaxID=1619087 RepID=A0A0G0JD22_9BACT|nr:MAG: hypothetical protein US52_C0051G0011 [candidate division WS6 bacterium GW2011_GWA2_37_6]
MPQYFHFKKTAIPGISNREIVDLYGEGYVLTRVPDQMDQVRSLRIDLSKFELSSENRRVLRKTEDISLFEFELSLPLDNKTNWRIFNLGKTFYKENFNDVEFSANKIREILYSGANNGLHFNKLLVYYKNNTLGNDTTSATIDHTKTLGYCILYKAEKIIHYCYPSYDLTSNVPNLGMGMMLKAITMAKEPDQNLRYIYLGSFSRPTDIYKLQFKGLEWWDGNKWVDDIGLLKDQIKSN